LPLQDVPQVVAVGAQKEVDFGRKQDRVHVLNIKTTTFRTLVSGGHADHLEETLVIPSQHRASAVSEEEGWPELTPKAGS
jgi:hypothetical protein